MKLSLLRQLAQLMLGLGLGAALGLAFDMLRVPRRHARSAVFRALLDGVFCLPSPAAGRATFSGSAGTFSRSWSDLAACAREKCARSRLREENS